MARLRNKLLVLTALCGLGTLFQIVPGSCTNYLVYYALSSVDFCSILNCSGASFFNFCSPVKLLVDCP